MPVHRPRSIEEVIEGFSPTSVGESAAAVARQVVAQAHPANAERAKAMLCAASKLAQFALNVGLVPTAEMVTDDALIERFILGGTDGFSGATRRTLRTNLRALARALAPAPGAVGLPRERLWGRRDSNPHCGRFKRPASASWATPPYTKSFATLGSGVDPVQRVRPPARVP
jgi:hypothetical protein